MLPAGAWLIWAGLFAGQAARAQAPDMEELWRVIQQQQAEIAELKSRLTETDARVEAAGAMLEDRENVGGHGAGDERTRIGGYGELHYNNLDSKDEVDFHRFVLFFGHEFTDSVRLFSELELEHAFSGDGEPGEVELEQAFIEMDLGENHRARAGVQLLPVGILNEIHEPNTFYGVERNPVEKDIIPATWWEAALSLNGELAPGWGYDLMLSSGLETPVTGASAFKVRSGRNKVAAAAAGDGAVSGRLKYTGLAGIELGAAFQRQVDVTQGVMDIDASLFEAHIDARKGPFGLRGLWAGWWLDDGPAGTGPAATGRDEQNGWYVEPSYRFESLGTLPGQAGVFVRYNEWDNNAGVSGATEKSQLDIGVNWWLHENVVFKFDYQNQMDSIDDDGFNLGMGYMF